MDETTYSDPGVIDLINDSYIAVRVDHDLRPDINARYNMGGWPTAAFLTPGGDLLSGCTYAPPDQFAGLLRQVADAYQQDKASIGQRAAIVAESAANPNAGPPADEEFDESQVERVVQAIQSTFDPVNGGFGSQPKFPHTGSLAFLLRWARGNEDPDSLAMVQSSLDAMLQGGLWDSSEGGFYRYATAADWPHPHFEKLLLDNLRLADLYLEGYLATGFPRYAETASQILAYAETNLFDATHGLFFGSQDADEEYYQLATVQRQTRAKPAVDATFYTDINALAASVYLKASWVLARPEAAERAFGVLERLLDLETSHSLRHSYNPDGSTGIPALLLDYAYFLKALLDAYDHTDSDQHREASQRVAAAMLAEVWDADAGGLFDTPKDPDAVAGLRHRLKPIEGNALAAEALLKLGHVTFDPQHRQKARICLSAVADQGGQPGEAASGYAMAVYHLLHPAIEVTLSGEPNTPQMTAMMLSAAALPYPNVVIKPGQLHHGAGEKALAEVCLDTLCLAPVADPHALRGIVMGYVDSQKDDGLGDIPIIKLTLPPA